MNILLKTFDGPHCKEMIETALSGFTLGTVLSLLETPKQMPDLPQAKKHQYINARKRREGKYESINWNECIPLDEELIESMRWCEGVFMQMVGRHIHKKSFAEPLSYRERHTQYLEAMRYWNHILETEHINVFLSNHIPHQGYDYVLYGLCKVKGIPMLMLDRFAESDTFFITRDWEEPADELIAKFTELKNVYKDDQKEIPLTPNFEEYYKTHEKEQDPWYLAGNRKEYLKHDIFFMRWKNLALNLLCNKPFSLLRLLLSPSIWRKKIHQHQLLKFYAKSSQANPHLDCRYIYVPLHMQPEATTCPKAGAFNDQQLMVELLAACIPDDVKLYVKDHPNQSDFMRSKEYYQRLMDIPSVTLISKKFSTFELSKHSMAIATATGTAGLEALFKEKPVLMFGHWLYQYAPGVHQIRSKEDCQKALQTIVDGGGKGNKREMRIFLKAMEEIGAPTVANQRIKETNLSQEKQAIAMGKYIGEKLRMCQN